MTTPTNVTDVSLTYDVARMVERLRTRDYLCDAMNPDGPEAADLLLRQQAVIGELREAVERALRYAQNIGVDSEGSSYVKQLRAALAKAR